MKTFRRYCKHCKQEADWTDSSYRYTRCRECYNTYQREYRKENRDKLIQKERKRYARRRKDKQWVESERERGKQYWQKLRLEVMEAYGGAVCACCGETEPKFLTIDHVNNDGAEHRRSFGYEENGKGASTRTLSWLKSNNYPEGFQVLCMNCNMGKARNGGICPHKILHTRTG